MRLVESDHPVSLKELKQLAQDTFGNLVKAVVDVEKKVMVIAAQLHSDEERFLLKQGSKQENLWGINLYPHLYPQPEWLEFDSVINLRPAWGNQTRGVDDPATRKKIQKIVHSLVKRR